MNEELITNLPSEIIINILSRLPVRTIATSKCVCKPWLDLIETPEFAKSHLSKSVTGLVVYQCEIVSNLLKIFDFKEAVEELHRNRITEIYREASFISSKPNVKIGGSANGLLFFCDNKVLPKSLYVCNPITRESIQLPQNIEGIQHPNYVTYGFGVSKMSCEYKIVRIYFDHEYDQHEHLVPSITKFECQVHTLGTATWRSIPPGDIFSYNGYSGVFVNGNLHWLVVDLKGSHRISCFNLETELFSSFSTLVRERRLEVEGHLLGRIVVLGDCLCLCDNNTWDDEIVIWVMKEYGVETSWTKEFVISKNPHLADVPYEAVYPLKVFRDGDILMWGVCLHLLYYSNKTKIITKLNMFQLRTFGRIEAMLHTPSFVSLKDFVLKNLSSF